MRSMPMSRFRKLATARLRPYSATVNGLPHLLGLATDTVLGGSLHPGFLLSWTRTGLVANSLIIEIPGFGEGFAFFGAGLNIVES